MKFNPAQKRDRHGRWTKGIAAVPYSRHSLKSHTIGVNAGTNVSPRYRVSAGVHFRVERRTKSAIEKKASAAHESVIRGLVNNISPIKKFDSKVESAIRRGERKVASKVLGYTVSAGKTNIRGGTTRSGLPSVTIRYGGKVKKASARSSGISQYNRQMAGVQAARHKVKTPRAQRRNVAGRKVA